jgi:serine/threonine protein kinase
LIVLVACDDPAAGRKLVERLESAGIASSLQTDAQALSSVARRAPPFAAILRWHSGNLMGILISRLRTWWPLPVLALAPDGDAAVGLRALRAGAWDVVPESGFTLDLAKGCLDEGKRIAGGGCERLGPYELYEMVGTGGMGVVYRAKDLRDNREVALKVLRPEQAVYSDFLARFEREVGEAMRLRHPCLTAVFEGGKARNRLYIAMEFVRGRTLEKVLADPLRLPARRALLIARRMAEGLAHAHGLGMVHRDIKPDNIVLGPNDEVKIMDFGLLRKADDMAVITAKGEFVGTVRYASPEHMRGERVDARGDIYSLGVVLYEMLAGKRPHDGRDTMRLAREVAYGAPTPALHEIAQDVPQEISALVHHMLQLKPADRPASMADVIRSLDALLR